MARDNQKDWLQDVKPRDVGDDASIAHEMDNTGAYGPNPFRTHTPVQATPDLDLFIQSQLDKIRSDPSQVDRNLAPIQQGEPSTDLIDRLMPIQSIYVEDRRPPLRADDLIRSFLERDRRK